MRGKRLVLWGVVALFVVAIASFMMTYTVSFNEAAVLTTFGQADEDAEAIREGLHFKLPYPFQSVTKYDTRVRLVQARAEAIQTADSRQIIVESFCLWRVSDPLQFYRRFNSAGERSEDHYREAERTLRDWLRSSLMLTSRYGLGELFPGEGGTSKLVDLESAVLTNLRERATSDDEGSGLEAYGIQIVQVGINRVALPQETTQTVIERMRTNRARLVKSIESRGLAEASAIESQADSNARRIMSFAELRGEEIKSQGDLEAAQYLAEMAVKPELAVFLKNLDLWRELTSKRTTLLFSTSFPGFELLSPDALSSLKEDEVPNEQFMRRIQAPDGPTSSMSVPASEPADAATDDPSESASAEGTP